MYVRRGRRSGGCPHARGLIPGTTRAPSYLPQPGWPHARGLTPGTHSSAVVLTDPGVLRWQNPAGRHYSTTPTAYPA